jgi:hypothetical protein
MPAGISEKTENLSLRPEIIRRFGSESKNGRRSLTAGNEIPFHFQRFAVQI